MLFPREIMIMILNEKSKLERKDRFEYAKSILLEKLKFPTTAPGTNSAFGNTSYSIKCGLHNWLYIDLVVFSGFSEVYCLFYKFKSLIRPIY